MKYRNIFHYIAGGITAWSAFVVPMLALCLCLSFLIYEVMNDWRKNDNSFKDVLEWDIGIFVVATIMLIKEVVF